MPVLIVGSAAMKSGVEYSGLIPRGNAFRMSEDVRVSVERTPFILLPKHEDIYSLSEFTYSFEEDTTIVLTRVVQDDLSIVFENSCPTTVPLVKNVESGIICSVIALEDTNTGSYAYAVYIQNDKNKDADVTVRLYANSILIDTTIYTVLKETSAQIGKKLDIATPITATQDIHITVEVNEDNNQISGTTVPTRIQITRIT